MARKSKKEIEAGTKRISERLKRRGTAKGKVGERNIRLGEKRKEGIRASKKRVEEKNKRVRAERAEATEAREAGTVAEQERQAEEVKQRSEAARLKSVEDIRQAEELTTGFSSEGTLAERIEAGFKNIDEVLESALTGRGVTVKGKEGVVKDTLEAVTAQNPLVTALEITAVGKALGAARNALRLYKTVPTTVGGLRAGTSREPAGLLRFANNVKNARLGNRLLTSVGETFRKPSVVMGTIGGMIGTYPWAEWSAGEAKEILGFTEARAREAAEKNNDPNILREFKKVKDEIYDTSLWEGIARMIPMANVAKGFMDKYKAMDFPSFDAFFVKGYFFGLSPSSYSRR